MVSLMNGQEPKWTSQLQLPGIRGDNAKQYLQVHARHHLIDYTSGEQHALSSTRANETTGCQPTVNEANSFSLIL